MNARRAATAIGMTVASVGMIVVVSVPAGAAGSNPNSAFCKLEKSSRSVATSKASIAASQALVAGNWKLAQKDLLSVDKQDASVTKQFLSVLSSAPASVQAAAKQLIKFEPMILNQVKTSTTAAQFEKSELALTNNPKFAKAGQVITSWDTSQCGSITGSSGS